MHLFLAADLPQRDPSRQWKVARGGAISNFQQYAHLARLDQLIKEHEELRVEIGQDYLISPDITVSFDAGLDRPSSMPRSPASFQSGAIASRTSATRAWR